VTRLTVGDVVLARELQHQHEVVYLLLKRIGNDWECLVLHSRCSALEVGGLYMPAEAFLTTGELL